MGLYALIFIINCNFIDNCPTKAIHFKQSVELCSVSIPRPASAGLQGSLKIFNPKLATRNPQLVADIPLEFINRLLNFRSAKSSYLPASRLGRAWYKPFARIPAHELKTKKIKLTINGNVFIVDLFKRGILLHINKR